MKTDELFYELFSFDPMLLFRLVGLELEGDYNFESITRKTVEKRLDGLLWRDDRGGPNVFLEVQGYRDRSIYWRLFRVLSTYYEQSSSEQPFVAIVLFVDPELDPGPVPLCCTPPSRMIRANLTDCLKALRGRRGTAVVLEALVAERLEDLPEQLTGWRQEIDFASRDEAEREQLLGLLEYAIFQRFSNLTQEELQAMIQLTPLDETVAGKQLIAIGIEKGIEKGELVGRIQLAQHVLNQPETPREELVKKPIAELTAMLEKLFSALR